jgi:hypothetical protein
MDFVAAARRIGDSKYETFFAGNVRQGFGHDFFYVGRWSCRRELRGERTSSDCDGQDDLFHSDYQWFSSGLLFFQSLTVAPVGIAPAAVFFAADDSKWISEETLLISGGLR